MKKFFNNRYNVLFLIFALLLIILGYRMAVLTIVEGASYREIADVKKIKDIPVKAPRGKIYDRNGVVLADNVPSFTVQMFTDQINEEDFNQISYTLSKILDINAENSIDEFPILLDLLEFKQNIKLDKTANEEVIDSVKDNINDWFNYETIIYGERFSPKELVLKTIKKDIKDLNIELKDGQFVFADEDEEQEVSGLTDERNKLKNQNPKDIIIEKLLNENKFILELFSNSKIRKFSFEFLKSIDLAGNIELVEYSFSYDNEFKNIKRNLSLANEEITDATNAKDDFVVLTLKNSIDNLLLANYESKNEKIIPGKILIERLKEIYPDFPVEYYENGQTVLFEFTDEKTKMKYLNQYNFDIEINALDFIKEMAAKNYNILYDFITNDEIKYYAQAELLKYINPHISIDNWEYTPIKNKKIWISKNIDSEENNTIYAAEESFNALREKLKVDFNINDYDFRNMLVIRERYNKTSYLSYHPVDIAYGISEKSVAMISERSHELNGINVEIEPLRSYPEKESAAHILGYLGKISQENEIKEYIDENGYSPEDIIGKTGVEEKFEHYLRGEKGKKTVEVNNFGETIKSVSSQAPVPGDDLYLTIDINLQKKAEESLKKGLEQIQNGGVFESEWGNFNFGDSYEDATSGSLVALDVKTGEVLAMANYPSYDLNMFSTGISAEDWNNLQNESRNPLAPKSLYNIAMLTSIQPGSTFKMVTALAALEKGVDPLTEIYCPGTIKVGDRNFNCWSYTLFGYGHGWQNMYEAIQNSCNIYFFVTVLGVNPATDQKHTVQVDVDDIIETAKMLGLDSKTGIEIDIPQESSGGVPSIDGKKSSIRVYLRIFLEGNLEKYLYNGSNLGEDMKNEIIEEIVSWIDREEPLTRGEVYENLKLLGVNPDITNNNNVPLVDIIKYSFINQAHWTAGDNLNIAIGQGSNSYTALQMSNYASIIANGGYKRNVSVIKEIKTFDGQKTDYIPLRESERIELSDYNHLEILKEGMRRVSSEDSGRPYANFPVEVGSKTGTAQKEGINPETGEPYDEFAWYVAFAPYDDPQIAVAIVLFQGGSGRYPTPIAREVIGEYLKIKGIVQTNN
ncbi:MAG: penicillin-binding transpeptidase domain-containing protein [Sedimentibacter sp.]